MTDQEINIAIAEACGWKRCEPCAKNGYFRWRTPENTGCRVDLPSYTTDLNAMHEAEKVFRTRHTTDFIEMRNWLFEICGRNADFAWHATAAQRAEAFLRTLGKWKD